MQPMEAWSLEWSDIDTVQKSVNIRTAKHGVPRIISISEKMVHSDGIASFVSWGSDETPKLQEPIL